MSAILYPAQGSVYLRDWGKEGERRYYCNASTKLVKRRKTGIIETVILGKWLKRTTSLLNCLDKPTLHRWERELAALHVIEQVRAGRKDWDALLAEAIKAPDVERDRAAAIGTEIHRVIEHYLREDAWPRWLHKCDPNTIYAAEQWLRWWEANGITATDLEIPVGSLSLGYGGTLDGLGIDPDGSTVLMDWKTSSRIWRDYLWQMASYAYALREMGRPLPDRCLICRIPKRGSGCCTTVHVWETPAERGRLLDAWRHFVTALNSRPPADIKEISFDAQLDQSTSAFAVVPDEGDDDQVATLDEGDEELPAAVSSAVVVKPVPVVAAHNALGLGSVIALGDGKRAIVGLEHPCTHCSSNLALLGARDARLRELENLVSVLRVQSEAAVDVAEYCDRSGVPTGVPEKFVTYTLVQRVALCALMVHQQMEVA